MKLIRDQQFETFTQECLIKRTKPFNDPIPRNKPVVFDTPSVKGVSKDKLQQVTLKQDMQLLSILYIACQTRDGNLEDFFRHEN